MFKKSEEYVSSYFIAKMLVVKDYLSPVVAKHKMKQIPTCKAVDFVQTQHELILK